MLTDPKLRSQVDQLWDKLWTGGLSNPLDAIEQFSYLLFLKRLDETETRRERSASMRGIAYTSNVPQEMRWSHWTNFQAREMLDHLRGEVFPWFRSLSSDSEGAFTRYMQNAELKLNKPNTLVEACNLIGEMQISAQNRDVQGDLYEYLLNKLSTAGRNGQFRTPRHIIRMMVEMTEPKAHERIGDLAAGTAGFLANAYEYVLEQNTSLDVLERDSDGTVHNAAGDLLTDELRTHLEGPEGLRGYDNDSGMTLLRIGTMNLMLHGINAPQFNHADTLSKSFTETRSYDVLLMNPPFKGGIDTNDVNDDFKKYMSKPMKKKDGAVKSGTGKSELLFLHLMLRALEMGGRAAVIVPEGVLSGSTNAHIETRKKLIEENRLEGVVSMPSGVFKPYAGVSTAVLFFTKGANTERIWFYDMAHDGLSLDDKRQKVSENDIPDILECWRERHDVSFTETRSDRIASLKTELAPLKETRLKMQAELNRLTFESVIASDGDAAEEARTMLEADQTKLNEVNTQITPLQTQFDRLTRQFWVSKEQVKAHKYELLANRYRQVEQDKAYFETPQVAIQRLLTLEGIMASEIKTLESLV